MISVIDPHDPRLQTLLGSAQERFQTLVDEAEARARPLYAQLFGEPWSIHQACEHIFQAIAEQGDAAIVHFNQIFDGGSQPATQLCLGPDDFAAAWQRCDPLLQQALITAERQITAYQERLLPRSFGLDAEAPLGARFSPLERVGSYVPGGTGGSLPLCSSVLMNLVPARVAGVDELILATPCAADGSVADEILAACHITGVDRLLRAGGIQAIAAMACGTATVPRVDKIVGPGNIFVTLAKRHAYGRVDIDMLAGPSEVLVIADDSVDPSWAAADLLSQAEHDALATSLCCAIGPEVAQAIAAACTEQLAALPEARRQTASASLERFGCIVTCPDLDSAVRISNRFAPEHLELLVRDPEALLPQLRHAGAIFIGRWSPEPIGDYLAGPSHTLPTGGTARMWSGIGADTFFRRTSLIRLSEDEFRTVAAHGLTLARTEGLEAHARSIAIRLG